MDQVQSKILAALEESVMEIVTTMLFIDIEPGHGIAKPSGVPHIPAKAEVSAMVGLGGDMKGGARLGCSIPMAIYLASTLAVEKFSSLEGDAKDAFAELANMIAGGIQTRIMGDEFETINLTPPSVIIGENYEIDYKSNIESVRHFFRVGEGAFYIEVFYELEQQFEERLENKLHVEVQLEEKTAMLLDEMAKEIGASRSETIRRLIGGVHYLQRTFRSTDTSTDTS
ncbi:MAG: chemotaxis protein CheX [Magnetococcales bacterium]|nr:chemotaxis protein CheX [Magnetococcales bacterium]